jgi:Ser/Thr protein kinase RdoA (MazF antagonist)
MNSEVLRRIPEIIDWDVFLRKVTKYLELGDLENWEPVEVGLEDANVRLSTTRGEYLFKGYASSRPQSQVDRYEEIFEIVAAENLPHPKLFLKNNKAVHRVDDIQFSVYEWVRGKTFYQMDRVPDEREMQRIIKIAADLNQLPIKPTFIHDNWAVYNLPKLYEEVRELLSKSDQQLTKKALDIYSEIDHGALPHAFVHDDITQQNLILADDGKIYLIDFGVANYYPRIQEIALMVSLLMDKDMPIQERIMKVVKEYEKYIKLTHSEKGAIFPYVVASQAMEVLMVHRERAKGSTLPELDYWLSIGRNGLMNSFADL